MVEGVDEEDPFEPKLPTIGEIGWITLTIPAEIPHEQQAQAHA